GRVPSARPHVRMRTHVVSDRRDRGGACPPQGRHGHSDRGSPQSPWHRRPEGGIPRRREGNEPGRTTEELRAPEPRDESALGRPERGSRLQRLPGPRRARMSRWSLWIPRGPGDLERRVPREDPTGADGIRANAWREEFPGPRGPRPPVRAAVVGLLRGEREVARSLRGMV